LNLGKQEKIYAKKGQGNKLKTNQTQPGHSLTLTTMVQDGSDATNEEWPSSSLFDLQDKSNQTNNKSFDFNETMNKERLDSFNFQDKPNPANEQNKLLPTSQYDKTSARRQGDKIKTNGKQPNLPPYVVEDEVSPRHTQRTDNKSTEKINTQKKNNTKKRKKNTEDETNDAGTSMYI